MTCGIVCHEFVKWGAAIFFILGISLISISPKSEWSYSDCLKDLFIFSSLGLSKLVETNFFISSSIILPDLWDPITLLISTPSSLANFLVFGLASALLVLKTLTFFFCRVSFGFVITGSGVFWIVFSFWTSFTSSSLISSIFSSSVPIRSIKEPSETLSPTFKFTCLTLPE